MSLPKSSTLSLFPHSFWLPWFRLTSLTPCLDQFDPLDPKNLTSLTPFLDQFDPHTCSTYQ